MPKSSNVPVTQQRNSKKEWRESRANIWFGFNFFAWTKALFGNHFRVGWRQLPLAIAITFASLGHGLLRWLEWMIYRRQIAGTEIKTPPVFIIGHWRCGTTLLHELLGLDSRHTFPNTYECFNPNHFLLTERLSGPRWNLFLPSHRPMDNMTVAFNRPQEDEFALCNLGVSYAYLGIAFPNGPLSYVDCFDLEQLGAGALQRWERAFIYFLKRITLLRPRRIILKSPVHTFRIKTLLKLFPQARFVHIVRNPYVVFPSTIHLWKSMFRAFSLQTPNFVGLEDYVFEMFNRLYDKLEETRELVPSSQFYQLRYEDLISNPIGEMRKLYSQLDLGAFESVLPALKDHLVKIDSYKTNRYELTPKIRDQITRRWGKIIKRYGYSI